MFLCLGSWCPFTDSALQKIIIEKPTTLSELCLYCQNNQYLVTLKDPFVYTVPHQLAHFHIFCFPFVLFFFLLMFLSNKQLHQRKMHTYCLTLSTWNNFLSYQFRLGISWQVIILFMGSHVQLADNLKPAISISL